MTTFSNESARQATAQLMKSDQRVKCAVICDLDGTLADIAHRRHFVTRPAQAAPVGSHPNINAMAQAAWKPDWDAFHHACVDDRPKLDVIEVASILADAGLQLWIVSGRSESVRAETEAWLDQHVGYYHQLVMRPVGDFTRDEALKCSWLKDGVIPPAQFIQCALDDRDRVVRMWRDAGVTCLQVAPGDF